MLGPELKKLLVSLARSGTEFIVVGGCAAVLQAVPIVTFDVDIVHRRSAENIDLLMAVLTELGAYHRADLARRKLPPSPSHFAGHGHVLEPVNTVTRVNSPG